MESNTAVSTGASFDWSHMGISIVMMVIMAFFCTGGVELFKDIYYYWKLSINNVANRYRLPDKKVKVKPEDKFFSEPASKMIAFSIAFWMCVMMDYGAINDIIQYGTRSHGLWTVYTDYVLTSAIIRLGAAQAYDLLAMLTQKALAAKALAQQLTATAAPNGQSNGRDGQNKP